MKTAVAGSQIAYAGTAMGACVMERANFTMLIAHQQDFMTSDMGEHIIMRVRYLIFERKKHPTALEQQTHFKFENGRIGKYTSMYS